MKLLEVQSSVRIDKSISRTLSDEFIQQWQIHHPEFQHKRRDVGIHPPNHPTELWTVANYTPPAHQTPEMKAALADSEQLIEELLWADYLVLGVPMYNFSVPSTFKAYLDNIVRVNRTFAYDPIQLTFEGLAIDRKALIITASAGDFTPNMPLGQMNFCETYLQSILNFIGIQDVTIVAVPNQFMSDEVRQQTIESARTKLMNLAKIW
jgi:FMN-dependent NADH-azoreductase